MIVCRPVSHSVYVSLPAAQPGSQFMPLTVSQQSCPVCYWHSQADELWEARQSKHLGSNSSNYEERCPSPYRRLRGKRDEWTTRFATHFADVENKRMLFVYVNSCRKCFFFARPESESPFSLQQMLLLSPKTLFTFPCRHTFLVKLKEILRHPSTLNCNMTYSHYGFLLHVPFSKKSSSQITFNNIKESETNQCFTISVNCN